MFLEDKQKEDKQKFVLPEVKTDPGTVQAFATWLGSRDAEEAYDFLSTDDCLICRYASSVKGEKMHFLQAEGFLGWQYNGVINTIVYGCDGTVHKCRAFEHTMGAALQRAKEVLASQ